MILRTLVGAGLQRTSGSYRELVELFNMPPADYKRFLNFLRKHQCHMPFQQFRGTPPGPKGQRRGRPRRAGRSSPQPDSPPRSSSTRVRPETGLIR